MNREIKFRCFNKGTGKMIDLYKTTPLALDTNLNCDGLFIPFKEGYELMQFTGHQISGVDLYENDIVRLEENADGIDPEDKMTWYVVTWIKEWCMFALLEVQEEYREYLNGGIDELDTTMFWTFPLEVDDTETSKHYLCGNIYENSELINQP